MPNHTSCLFRVTGTKAELEAFMDKARFTDKNEMTGTECIVPFALSAFIPVPKELMEIASPVKILPDAEYKRQMSLPTEKGSSDPLIAKLQSQRRFISETESNALIEKYGANNWYDWTTENYGTKWDIYDQSDAWRVMPESIEIHFNSAWSPPTQGITTISKQFPNLQFYIAYADEGGFYIGYSEIHNGECEETMLPHQPWDGPDQKEFRRLCGQETD